MMTSLIFLFKMRYTVNHFSIIYNQAQNSLWSLVNRVYSRRKVNVFLHHVLPSVPSGLLSQGKMMKGKKIKWNEKQKNKTATARRAQHKLFLLRCYTAYCSTTSETLRERKRAREERRKETLTRTCRFHPREQRWKKEKRIRDWMTEFQQRK